MFTQDNEDKQSTPIETPMDKQEEQTPPPVQKDYDGEFIKLHKEIDDLKSIITSMNKKEDKQDGHQSKIKTYY